MRTIVIDWLMELCCEHSLRKETCYLSINYLDRCLSLSKDIDKSNL